MSMRRIPARGMPGQVGRDLFLGPAAHMVPPAGELAGVVEQRGDGGRDGIQPFGYREVVRQGRDKDRMFPEESAFPPGPISIIFVLGRVDDIPRPFDEPGVEIGDGFHKALSPFHVCRYQIRCCNTKAPIVLVL